ncbi:hypothetical protein ACHAXA_005549 [Cyclostephanos tholiformis]|uniref:PrcB C-terminal domain-containing protein n=1 Tax=Cyclostephanos tholiformis TaxID=382380 RepID=A0ABD3RG86_9STRA
MTMNWLSKTQRAAAVALLLISLIANISVTSIPFETIDKGVNSAIEDPLTEVYRTGGDFAAFWARHTQNAWEPPPVPIVDFASQIVIAVFRGTKFSGGYGVEVVSVDQGESGSADLVVNFLTSDPSPDDMVSQALTQAYHIVNVNHSGAGRVTFEGSGKPPPARPIKFILTVARDSSKVEVRSKIEAFPAVMSVQELSSLSIIFVDFDSEKVNVDQARKMLEGVNGVESVERDR